MNGFRFETLLTFKPFVMHTKFFFTFLLIVFSFTVFGQTTGTLYKNDRWGDQAKYDGSIVKAMQNMNYENVEILKTDKFIKTTFGNKVNNYKIIAGKKFSDVKIDYTVTLNNKEYILSIADMPDGTVAIGINSTWFVKDITDISTIKIK